MNLSALYSDGHKKPTGLDKTLKTLVCAFLHSVFYSWTTVVAQGGRKGSSHCSLSLHQLSSCLDQYHSSQNITPNIGPYFHALTVVLAYSPLPTVPGN